MDIKSINQIAIKLGDVINAESRIVKGVYSTVYLSDKYVYKVASKSTYADYKKESDILRFLEHTVVKKLVPSVLLLEKSGEFVIQIQSRLGGEHKKSLTLNDYRMLGEFLRKLHMSITSETMHEFEDEEFDSIKEYVTHNIEKYSKKLQSLNLNAADRDLCNKAVKFVMNNIGELEDISIYPLVHKDLSLNNLLFDEKGLSGVIDFGAAQFGIPEWEITIIRQRFNMSKEENTALMDGYGLKISEKLVALTGIVQSLRFWKSHPKDAKFVGQQRDYIMECMKII